MTPAMRAIADSPVVQMMSRQVPSPMLCPICEDCGPLPFVFRPEMFVHVSTPDGHASPRMGPRT